MELPLTFEVDGDLVVGILHEASREPHTAVVIVVGGPQYRVGSHRQFVKLARNLCGAGHDVMRFDFRGMGDSQGSPRGFEEVAPDIRAAIDEVCRRRARVQRIVLLGLCDGSSAALMYAPTDERVVGLVLLNPWARSPAGAASARLKGYYVRRLFAAGFWKKLLQGNVQLGKSLAEVAQSTTESRSNAAGPAFLNKMESAAKQFRGAVFIALSGNDLTATEFATWMRRSVHASAAFAREGNVTEQFPTANHTFSSSSSHAALEAKIGQFMQKWR